MPRRWAVILLKNLFKENEFWMLKSQRLRRLGGFDALRGRDFFTKIKIMNGDIAERSPEKTERSPEKTERSPEKS